MTDTNQHKNGNTEKHANTISAWRSDLAVSLTFLTRLRVKEIGVGTLDMAGAMRAFPLVGVIIGTLGGLICALAFWLGIAEFVAAALGITSMVLVTGALHEDALSDVADGFGGGDSVERKLEIMKDSRVGAFGVTALILVLLIKISSLASIANGLSNLWLVIAVCAAAAAWSRTLAVSLMATTNNARGDGLASAVGLPNSHTHYQTLVCGTVITALLLWTCFGWLAACAAIAASVAVFWCVRRLAIGQIGGHTGDVAGTVQSLTETTIFASLTAFV